MEPPTGSKLSKQEANLLQVIHRIRSADLEHLEELDAQDIFDAIKSDGIYAVTRNLTLVQVKKVDELVKKTLRDQSRLADVIERAKEEARRQREAAEGNEAMAEEDNEEAFDGFKRYRALGEVSAELSCAVGDGLREATVRQAAYVWIQAVEASGRTCTTGGSNFRVSIRGPSQTRARLSDNGDGTYLAVWRPHCSGAYSVTVTLNGHTLPGSPHLVHAVNTQPCAARCEVRGRGLVEATSRVPQSFECRFRDKFGHVATAVDLDLFVEECPLTSPRNRPIPLTAEELKVQAEAEAKAEAKALEIKRKVKRVEEGTLVKKSMRVPGGGLSARKGKAEHAAEAAAAAAAAAAVEAEKERQLAEEAAAAEAKAVAEAKALAEKGQVSTPAHYRSSFYSTRAVAAPLFHRAGPTLPRRADPAAAELALIQSWLRFHTLVPHIWPLFHQAGLSPQTDPAAPQS